MKSIYPYLYFNGNCRAAVEYYQSCLGAKVEWLGNCNGDTGNSVEARIIIETTVILAADYSPNCLFSRGNAATLFIKFHSSYMLFRQFERLVADGIVHLLPGPVAGGLMAELSDPFGVRWIFFFPAPTNSSIFL
ncbi:MAG TPA: hypothetical protein VFS31_07525 [Chitinophagaceae bacterium]|nr:hypothetical protein [Chitinophagaceae bacterium]